MNPDDTVKSFEDLAQRFDGLGFHRVASELRGLAGIEEEWPEVVLEDILDAEYVEE